MSSLLAFLWENGIEHSSELDFWKSIFWMQPLQKRGKVKGKESKTNKEQIEK